MKILYIHPFPVFGGATKSLVELLSAVKPNAITKTAIAPNGPATQALENIGVKTVRVRGISQWDNTRFSHYKGPRWVILLRELMLIPSTLIGIKKAHQQGPYDIIHCNEITVLFSGIIAKHILKAPLVLHVRSLQEQSKTPRRTRFINSLLHKHVDAVIAIDEAVRRTLPETIDVDIINNGLKVPKLTSHKAPQISDNPFTVGIIGSLSVSKGVIELVRAIAILRDKGIFVRLLIAGENVRNSKGLYGKLLNWFNFSTNTRADIAILIDELKLNDRVELLGFVSNITSLFSKLNLLCFPSRLDAPGRPVFEAALHELPSIVAMEKPTKDVLIDGETGIIISNSDPSLIADAIEVFHSNPDATHAMGKSAREHTIKRFDSKISGEKILALYQRIITQKNVSTAPNVTTGDQLKDTI